MDTDFIVNSLNYGIIIVKKYKQFRELQGRGKT
jgi:hypothetical protein